MTSTQTNNPFPPDLLPRLDPRFVEYYDKNLAGRLGTHQVPLEEVRANPQKWARKWPVNTTQSRDSLIYDWKIAGGRDSEGFRIRTYHPNETLAGPGPYAVHLNFHGGGWVFGDLTTDATLCQRLSDQLPLVVVDVEYRLCPEAQFGQNLNDAWAALLWTLENAFTLDINPLSVSIGGISAGAHLACVLQHRARDANIALKLLIAAVPPLADHDQYEKPTDSPWPSFSEFSHIPMLNWERMSFFKQQAFPTEKLANIRHMYPAWWISPLRAPNFANLCDTFIATAECDILRDEGEAYGKKLIEAGNRVTFRRYLKVPHSFMYMTSVLPQAEQYQEDVFNALRVGHGL